MRIHLLLGQLKDGPSTTTLELLAAWDEYVVEANGAGWEEAKEKAKSGYGSDLLQWREAFVDIDDDRLDKLFELPDLTAKPKIQNPLGHPPGVR